MTTSPQSQPPTPKSQPRCSWGRSPTGATPRRDAGSDSPEGNRLPCSPTVLEKSSPHHPPDQQHGCTMGSVGVFRQRETPAPPFPGDTPKGLRQRWGCPELPPGHRRAWEGSRPPPAKAITPPVRQRINIVLKEVFLEAPTAQNQALENNLQLPLRKERDGNLARDSQGAHPQGHQSWDLRVP